MKLICWTIQTAILLGLAMILSPGLAVLGLMCLGDRMNGSKK